MKRLFCGMLAAVMLLLAGCGGTSRVDVKQAKTLAELKGAKLAAQAGTFHAEALEQVEDVQASTYPEFSDLLTALKSGAIDGYVAEEPTALSVCGADDSLTYLPLKNNDTGFTATAADVGIAVGLKKGSELREQLNAILAEITPEQRAELMEQIVALAAGKSVEAFALEIPETDGANGVLRVGMECAYEPYNWTEMNTPSLGAVPISGEGKQGLYANGYDVQIAPLPAGSEPVEVAQAGGDAGDAVAVVRHPAVHLPKGIQHQAVHVAQAAGKVGFTFQVFDKLMQSGQGIAQIHRLIGGYGKQTMQAANHLAPDIHAAQDKRMILQVGGRCHPAQQTRQFEGAAHELQLATGGKLGTHRNDVYRLARAVHGKQGGKDFAILRFVKHFGAQLPAYKHHSGTFGETRT